MALLGPTQMGCVTLVLTVLLGLSSTGEGAKQELWMYTQDGTYLVFTAHYPDLAEFWRILPRVTQICPNGLWLLSKDLDYETHWKQVGSATSSRACTNNFNMTNVKSLRYYAASDTTADAISLYTGFYQEGEEIFVDTEAKSNISIPIESIAASGTSDWMLYEGKNFDGNSSCYKVPLNGLEFNWGFVKDLNIDTVGSVFKGCDLHKIQLYKESLLLST